MKFSSGHVYFAAITVAFAAARCGPGPLSREDIETFSKAQTFYSNQKFAEAENVLKPVYENHPERIESGVLLAKVYFFTRKFRESEEILQRLLSMHESNPYVMIWLGKLLAVQETRMPEAVKIFQKVLKNDPENFAAHYYLGRCLEDSGKIKEALAEYQSALAMEQQLSKIHLHMGLMLHDLQMEDRSREHFAHVRFLNIQHDVWVLDGKSSNRNESR